MSPIPSPGRKIVMIAGIGEYPKKVYNYLMEHQIEIHHLIIEDPISTRSFLRRRVRKLGLLHVLGQVLNRLLVVPILKVTSKNRIEEINELGQLRSTLPSEVPITRVPSANSPECLEILQKIDPCLVLIIDTRILSKRTLSAISGKILNVHAGITPKYRGWHGGYWALTKEDPGNCGVTVHLVDEGIDTGGILYQKLIKPTKKDNYYTYPSLQLVTVLPLLEQAIQDVLTDHIQVKASGPTNDGDVYYHPTIWEYFYYRIKLGVK